jgi:hypothetical protein
MTQHFADSDLSRWLRNQFGRGKKYRSPRALSLAASDGKNHNVVYDILRRGTADPETLVKLAKALEVPVAQLFLLVGWIRVEDLSSGMSTDDLEMLFMWRKLPQEDQEILRKVAERLLQTA